ncbi:MAG: hypothetical protein VX111_00260 [Planctomycetota bacterium]|nr:hypothetical protein [Planctomycetota bacterium]
MAYRPWRVQVRKMVERFLIGGVSVGLLLATSPTLAQAPAKTTLENPSQSYRVAKTDYVVLNRGEVEAVIVNNAAVDDRKLPGHRGGYSGIASLKRGGANKNLFVPSYAGLNFEHIHDGTSQPREILFEPRHALMELRVIDASTVELYQAPTPTWGLESATRYAMLADGTIEMTFECIPRRDTFRNGYIGLFWASYIHQPESLAIHFRGRRQEESNISWIHATSPRHGAAATHVHLDDARVWKRDNDFPLSLVYNRSNYRYADPFYFGVNEDLALVFMFRPQDEIRLSQSPSGGGVGNPAWDFQWMIPQYEVGRRYQMVMRLQVVPYEDSESVWIRSAPHRKALASDEVEKGEPTSRHSR